MSLDRERKRQVTRMTSKRLVRAERGAGDATLEDGAASSSDGGLDLSSIDNCAKKEAKE